MNFIPTQTKYKIKDKRDAAGGKIQVIAFPKVRLVPIILKLSNFALKYQYFASITLFFNLCRVKLLIDRLCIFTE